MAGEQDASRAATPLRALRVARGISQERMATAIGISLATYRRLESGRMINPPLRYLVNAALVLAVELDDVVDPKWRTWLTFDARSPGPPAPEDLWTEDPREYRA